MAPTLLFDLDETLVAEEPAAVAAFEATAQVARRPLPLDVAQLAQDARTRARELWRAAPTYLYCLAKPEPTTSTTAPSAEPGFVHTAFVHGAHRQSGYRVRYEWGVAGAAAVASDAEVVVVVDVLSFTTTLSVAVDAGIAVLPYPSNDASAETFARDREAVLAVGRSQGGTGQFTLSPASVRVAPVQPQRLVLPSPNGSALARRLDGQAATCVGACLRNASAVAAWLAGRHGPGLTTVAVIAAGERWDDGTLRAASEDLWGAGALVTALAEVGWSSRSPEADLAGAGYDAIRGGELDALRACASGRELVELGYASDVAIAAETESSSAVPVLSDGIFVPAPPNE